MPPGDPPVGGCGGARRRLDRMQTRQLSSPLGQKPAILGHGNIVSGVLRAHAVKYESENQIRLEGLIVGETRAFFVKIQVLGGSSVLLDRFIRIVWLVSIVCIMPAVSHAEQATYAERLGWPAGTKAVIFHVDDVGMSHNSNMGGIKAIEDGIATSLSIMMPCSWVPEFAAYLKTHPATDAGLHLTLTSEWKNYRWGPVADKSAVPGLVDRHGYLWPKVSDVVAHATAGQVETEIRAQIDKALSMGIDPTHLDAHMGTCFHPQFVDRYVKVAIEKKIPILMFAGHMQHIGGEAANYKPLIRSIAEKVWNAGLPVIDDLVTQPTRANDYEEKKAELTKLLHDMKPGITEVIVHCTVQTEVFSHISGSGPSREAELRLMTDPDIKAFIQSQGIILTTWRELKERRALVQNR